MEESPPRIFKNHIEEIESKTSSLRSSYDSEDCITSSTHSSPKFPNYTPSNGYHPKQFSGELLNQLKEHERFISQRQKYTSDSAIPKNETTIKINPPNYSLSEIGVQMNNQSEFLQQKCSNAHSRERRRMYRKASQDLFNPSFEMNTQYNPRLSTLGKSLIESIRCKVFGKQKNVHYMSGDCDDWGDDGSGCELNVSFPKETRHAICNLVEQRSRVYDGCACLESSENELGVVGDNKKKSFKQLRKLHKPNTFIPCPLNLLCDKGIHVGKCEDSVRKKVAQTSLCGKNCSCRKELLFVEKRNKFKYETPKTAEIGKKRKNNLGEIKTVNHPKIHASYKIEEETSDCGNPSYSSLSRRESSSTEIMGSGVSSTETFLKLMEPQILRENWVRSLRASVSSIMNGLNGHTNGDLNGCGDIITQNQQKGCWTIGLINSKYRYLTAETFGFKINANGTSLKKKQIWTLEPENANNGDSLIYLRSHLDKYLAVDSFGNVTCESDEKDPGCQFQISVAEDGSGRWALKNVVRGYFLGSTLDKLTCTAKVPGDSEFWHVHLAARPQVNLRSIGRKRFAHLSENLDEIHVDANIPWGEDTLFTLEFRLEESGKYAIHTCNNKYLSMGGKLVDTCNKDCLFSAEYHSGQLALRDRTGAYLSPIGSKAVLKTRSNSVTKDELFSLEDSLPQASFVASLNSRFVSVKQGVDVTANQDEISDHETFQLEFDWSTKRWYIRTMQDRYWTLETGGGIQACGDKRSSNALFDLVWQNDGSLAFRANNGRYVITKRSGHLYATSDTIDDNCKYFFYLINRPILVLKCEQGFVGYKSGSNPKLECNKATYECIQVERGEKGVVYFKGQSGKYWHADSEGVTADSDGQEGFYLELREPTRLCIKSLNGNYLAASKNGLFRLGDTSIENATQWEY